MTQLTFVATATSAIGLPLIALIMLMVSKLSVGDAARRAERRFLALLVIMSVVTARTVTTIEPTWLIHTVTLAVMIIGSLWIPGQNPPQPSTNKQTSLAGS
ncbi:hypothetical protein LOC71_00975 [Rhodopirellula sp. JC740]|uniref:Uncharacterized protein n=1 Tax=Rhodopirellula halodulae TaxID=2894198 RepID=A0ABS8NB95_9BACT|nr:MULTISPECIES: hypothetical protein [unclassified Rhodopirellula]MCC9640830.1 hypothetical protein [Rhodopirellula sp. JC740]MCC9655626.1 hypothetical protein [Rhodopirellula sp. JC737]